MQRFSLKSPLEAYYNTVTIKYMLNAINVIGIIAVHFAHSYSIHAFEFATADEEIYNEKNLIKI